MLCTSLLQCAFCAEEQRDFEEFFDRYLAGLARQAPDYGLPPEVAEEDTRPGAASIV